MNPQQIIIRDNTYAAYDPYAVGQFQQVPYEYKNNVKRFNEARASIYGGANKYGEDPYFNFGFRQPYVWVGPDASTFTKEIKRFDTRVMPIGSVAQDAIRIGKMFVSGKGLLFMANQLILQSHNVFNETTLYNPLSVMQSVLRPASFGIIKRPTRHVDLSGGLFGGIFGGSGAKAPPPGTTASTNASALSVAASSDGAGMIRAKTANTALLTFNNKWDINAASKKPSFLQQMLSSVAPGLVSNYKQSALYRSDEIAFDTMLGDSEKATGRLNVYYSGQPSYIRNELARGVSGKTFSVGNFTPQEKGVKYEDVTYSEKSLPPESENVKQSLDKILQANGSLFNKLITPNKPRSKIPISSVKSNATSISDGIPNSAGTDPDGGYHKQFINKNKEGPYPPIQKYGLSSPDGYTSIRNGLDKLATKDVIGNPIKTPKEDLILFFLKDLVNNRYIYFKSSISTVQPTSQTQWSNYTYIGRADTMYIYKGFTRDVSVSFKIYPNNYNEFVKNWRKINYLQSTIMPARYDDDYIVPPFFNVTIGNLYTDQPVIIQNVQVQFDDGVVWEIHSERDNLPMFISITLQFSLLEKRPGEIGNNVFGIEGATDIIQYDFRSEKSNSQLFFDKLAAGTGVVESLVPPPDTSLDIATPQLPTFTPPALQNSNPYRPQ